MTEDDIKGNMLALQGAVAHKDEAAAVDAATNLVLAGLLALNRIATALEQIEMNTRPS